MNDILIYVDVRPERNKFSYVFPLELMTHNIETAIHYPKTLILYVGWHQDITNLLEIVAGREKQNFRTKLILDGRSEETGLMKYSDFTEETYNKLISKFEHILITNEVVLREKSEPLYCNTIAVDMLGLVSYKRCFIDGEHPVNNVPVEYRKNGLNLLVGKIKTRFCRFVTLYKFYKHDLLDKSILGIHADPTDIQDMMEKYAEYHDLDFYKKIVNHLGPADQAVLMETSEGKTTLDSWPFDPNIYSNSSVSYVCETFDYDKGHNPYLMNEKTYRPIINRHPFVVQGSNGQLQTIKQLGFMTFSDIIDETYNDEYLPNAAHVELAVQAAKNLVQKIPNNKELVQEIVDYNLKQFCSRIDKQYKDILKTIIAFANS